MDKELLFKPRLPEDEIPIPGVGTVRVRGLNRDESVSVAKIEDVALRDRHIIAIGMVDPRLSVSEVERWGKAATGGELEKVSRKIAELSGMLDDSAKEAVKNFRGEPGDGVRVLPGAEAVDDSGRATGTDVG